MGASDHGPRTAVDRGALAQDPRQLTHHCRLDPKLLPADEVRALHHERWEIEPGYDEVKTDMLDRQEAIRSKTVKGASEELWAIALAYNLVLLEMERSAKRLMLRGRESDSSRAIRDEWAWAAGSNAPGAIPKNLRTFAKKRSALSCLHDAESGSLREPRRSR